MIGSSPARSHSFLALLAVALLLATGSAGLAAPPMSSQQAVGPASSDPLAPPDTSSPRDTIASFLQSFHEAVKTWESGAPVQEVEVPLLRALRCLDLSDVPEASYQERGVELAFYLKGILQRIALPPPDQMPGKEAIAAHPVESWRIPGTELVIGREDKGPRAGEYIFTKETVARLPKFFELVRSLPVRPSPTATPDAFEAYRLGPGRGMPSALGAWIQRLPDGFYVTFLDQPMWKWAGLAILALLSAGIVTAFALLGRYVDRRLRNLPVLLRIGQPLAAIVTILLTFALSFWALYALRMTGQVGAFISSAIEAVRYAGLAWLVALIVNRIGEAIVRSQGMRPASLDSQLIRLLFRLLSILAVLYVAMQAATQLGVPVGPLLAGVGVTGLAIALAVRPLLENIIGGFVLFADKPIRVGDFCVFGDKKGTVEQIGLRSTRIRGVDRTVISVPNAEFSQLQIINLTRRDRMLFHSVIGLRYETTTEQLRYVLARIREMLIRHVRVNPEPLRVRFIDYGASSLDIEIFAFVNSADYNEYLGIREDINFRIKDIVEGAGTGFAFPSRTLYMARDQGPSATRAEEVAGEVEAWRSAQRLPFPEFDRDERDQLADTLAYPPEGSPHLKEPSAPPGTPPEPPAGRRRRRQHGGQRAGTP